MTEDPMSTILVVDDDTELRKTLTDLLRGAGFAVVDSPDGEAAFEALLAMRHCDAVLLDLQMPRLSGRQFVDRIRGYVRFRDVPVVAMTAFDNIPKPPTAATLLRKPLTLQTLIDTLKLVATDKHRMSSNDA